MRNIHFGVLIGLVMSGAAQAHVELGFYDGKTDAGTACAIEVKDVHFEDNMRHPLNERVTLSFNGAKYTIMHPGLLDEVKGEVKFNHDRLVGFKGMVGGSIAAILNMEETDDHDGPKDFIVIRDHALDPRLDETLKCLNLVKRP